MTDELRALARDLGAVPAAAVPNARKALQVTARHVKDDWNGKLYTDGHAQRTGRSITYDTEDAAGSRASSLTAEIGPIRGSGRQAYMVRLLELGSANNGPHGYGTAALQDNEADFQHGLDLALRDAEKAAGL